MKPSTIPIVEVFGPTLQGEGHLAGQRTMFIRTGYCDGAGDQWCKWCDSMFAVDPKNKGSWTWMTPREIADRVHNLAPYCRYVTISGGNPVLHDLSELVGLLKISKYNINVETQGTVYKEWLSRCTSVTVSPKPPSAGQCNLARLAKFMHHFNPHVAQRLGTAYPILKVVVDPRSERDYRFATNILRQYPWVSGRYISIVTLPDDTRESLLRRYKQVADMVCQDDSLTDVAVLPQLHVLLWGHKQGV